MVTYHEVNMPKEWPFVFPLKLVMHVVFDDATQMFNSLRCLALLTYQKQVKSQLP